jgi:hypothetical protein
MKRMILILILIAFAAPSAYAVYAEDSEVLIQGIPLRKAESSIDNSEMKIFDHEESEKFQLVIIKEKGKNLWFTREKTELTHTKEGEIHVFVNQQGKGYIKVLRTTPDRCIYMEHMIQGMATVTYWGISLQCTLE